MSIEIDTLIETYTTLKEYVPAKERQAAADALMSVMVDMLADPDIKELAGVDAYLKRSYEEYSQDGDGEDEEADYGYED
jgi:cytochrome c553